MSDRELDRLRKRKRLQMQKRFQPRKPEEQAMGNKDETAALLNHVFGERAWEVFAAAKRQYPAEMTRVEAVLRKLISEGKVTAKITGEDLYSFLYQLGLRVRLSTRIHFMEHGKLKSIAEKMKENK